MGDEQYTRCPGCTTIFRVTPAQLALRNGQVRCGHCRTVFDGVAQRISLAPAAAPNEPEIDEYAAGPPTVTLRSAKSLEPPPPAEPRVDTAPSVQQPVPDSEDEVDYDSRFAWDKPRKSGRGTAWFAAIAVVLLLLLAGQALMHFRDAVAARWPVSKPALAAMCRPFGCALRPLRDVAALSIDASDLQADPAHKGLLILSATLRNRAAYALDYPYLELTLTDANDQVVVRRALTPGEYAGGTADLERGIGGNAEVLVKLFIDASATTQAGYRLYLFYP
ncbi:MAG TPA: DUF3426 domain-containing protein [Casimicrobiaceae bacterium]|nr:DUF3426 domain-containing protein [Casimicrobiaceae bacterium]